MPLRVTTPPASPPLALDAAATAARLGEADTALVEDWIRRATDYAESLSGIKIYYREYEQYRQIESGYLDPRFYLRARPVWSVSSARFGTDDALVEGTESDAEFEIWADQGFLNRPDCWDYGAPGWRIQFSAGYWLPSMGPTPPPGVQTLAIGAPRIEGAIFDIVKATGEASGKDATVKRRKLSDSEVEYHSASDLWIPKSSISTIKSLCPVLG